MAPTDAPARPRPRRRGKPQHRVGRSEQARRRVDAEARTRRASRLPSMAKSDARGAMPTSWNEATGTPARRAARSHGVGRRERRIVDDEGRDRDARRRRATPAAPRRRDGGLLRRGASASDRHPRRDAQRAGEMGGADQVSEADARAGRRHGKRPRRAPARRPRRAPPQPQALPPRSLHQFAQHGDDAVDVGLVGHPGRERQRQRAVGHASRRRETCRGGSRSAPRSSECRCSALKCTLVAMPRSRSAAARSSRVQPQSRDRRARYRGGARGWHGSPVTRDRRRTRQRQIRERLVVAPPDGARDGACIASMRASCCRPIAACRSIMLYLKPGIDDVVLRGAARRVARPRVAAHAVQRRRTAMRLRPSRRDAVVTMPPSPVVSSSSA